MAGGAVAMPFPASTCLPRPLRGGRPRTASPGACDGIPLVVSRSRPRMAPPGRVPSLVATCLAVSALSLAWYLVGLRSIERSWGALTDVAEWQFAQPAAGPRWRTTPRWCTDSGRSPARTTFKARATWRTRATRRWIAAIHSMYFVRGNALVW